MKLDYRYRVLDSDPPNQRVNTVSPRRRTGAVSIVAASTICASLLLVIPASAESFFFSTGEPDGLIATLSRPDTGGQLQTETADDFVLTECTSITQATFTGLIPEGADLSTISQVEVEIYHVFPNDSQDPPSGNVPTRVNSPGDVEIDDATRDSLDGSLSFSVNLVNASFTAANSVINGINPFPDQFTGGEGAVTGEEVSITVTFNPPILLPADHYFFRPEVLLSSGDFLWLSAPKPIVPPGTPLTTDLQSWIRNDNLAPDWLRIGTDITEQGPFNASFSLSGETDTDNDGINDCEDQCPDTAPGAVVNAEGCSLDQLVPCGGPVSGGTWKSHGEYVSTFVQATQEFLSLGLITEDEEGVLISAAAKSDCGAKVK